MNKQTCHINKLNTLVKLEKQYAYFLQLDRQSVTRQEAIKSLEWAKEYYKSFPGMENIIK